MKGNNKFVLCKEEMIQAIEYYLNERVFQKENSVTVTSVASKDSVGTTFVVEFEELAKTEAGTNIQ